MLGLPITRQSESPGASPPPPQTNSRVDLVYQRAPVAGIPAEVTPRHVARKETLTTCYSIAHISGRPHTVSLTPSRDTANHTLEIGTKSLQSLREECPDLEALWLRVQRRCGLELSLDAIYSFLKNFQTPLIIKWRGNKQ